MQSGPEQTGHRGGIIAKCRLSERAHFAVDIVHAERPQFADKVVRRTCEGAPAKWELTLYGQTRSWQPVHR